MMIDIRRDAARDISNPPVRAALVLVHPLRIAIQGVRTSVSFPDEADDHGHQQ